MGLQDENRESFDEALAKANDLEQKKKALLQNQQPIDISPIDSMDAEQLRILIRKLADAVWGIKAISGADFVKNAIKSNDELYEALMLKAITFALNAYDAKEFNTLATFWAERTKGKPMQSIDLNHKIGIVAIVQEAKKRNAIKLQPTSDSLLSASVNYDKIIDNQ